MKSSIDTQGDSLNNGALKRRKKKKKHSSSIDISSAISTPSFQDQRNQSVPGPTVWRTLSGGNSDGKTGDPPLSSRTRDRISRVSLKGIPGTATDHEARSVHGLPASSTSYSASETRTAVGASPYTSGFFEYVRSELSLPSAVPAAGDIWGQTERDRVYNAIVLVPYQLERLLLFGQFVALSSFLGVLTLLPIRVFRACWGLFSHVLHGLRQRPPASPSFLHTPPVTRDASVTGQQLFDCVCGAVSVAAVLILMEVNPGLLYFWLKDLTQEFLKLHVMFTALEIADKTLCNFGVDTMDALLGSCCAVVGSGWQRGKVKLMTDALLALGLVVLHGLVLVNQAMVFSVAVNSKKQAVTALLIAANFVEIKGTIFKRFDSHKLMNLTCQDIVERCHLAVTLLFVLAEDMKDNAQQRPDMRIVRQCGLVYGSEVLIDIIKHAVLGKLNDVRPGIYREFMRDMCETVRHTPSHRMSKSIGVLPYSVAALCIRIAITVFTLKKEVFLSLSGQSVSLRIVFILAGWLLLCLFHFWFGYLLRKVAGMYLDHYEAMHARTARPRYSRMNTEPAA